ncbi:anti-sigma factor family protein [Kibdelosporangium aridum]|uniref:Putative zinc-finger n=1 Tax=Kibdelosporangium aridum TaxID=2030 RepID=A0A1W2A8V7_KIBAR|nr:anti-sigma factor [Kibdelosporangium aridum]SMC57097.1 Putative zinc-finger [Kibdelosporangium aridum]
MKDELTCAELVELVTDYLEGALDPETTERFYSHLAICAGCGPYLDQMRMTVRTLGELPQEAVPAEVRDALLAAFREGGQTT